MDKLNKLRQMLDQQEADVLSGSACLSQAAVRRKPDVKAGLGLRQEYALDADRVLHSLAYTRYIDKTQVFSLMDNDLISHRVLHVQLVSKIGRTIGRYLGLNQDLIEAIALAHDIGHPPFGHDGEVFLTEKCLEHGLPPFQHNLQGVRFLEKLEKKGRGLNLTLQVLDGVLCHDGEARVEQLTPQANKNFASLDAEYAAKEKDPAYSLRPMTWEGCVVRLADSVAYVGRDLEDAILVGLVNRSDLPAIVREVLGDTNGTIVYRLVEDLVHNSTEQDILGFSEGTAQALTALKDFNYQNIYFNPVIKTQHHKVQYYVSRLFDRYMGDLRQGISSSPIFKDFWEQMDSVYKDQTQPAEVVRDYLSSLTDDALIRQGDELVAPRRFPARIKTN